MQQVTRRARRWLREWLPFAVGVLCLFAVRSSIADHYVVPSGSMQNTLLPGDRVLVDKRAYGLRLPFTLVHLTQGSLARGDIVIFDSPADGVRLIKRVVAIGGDAVEVRDGRVRINGADADESALPLDFSFGGGPVLAPTRVPAGEVLVLGDARGNSNDGRVFGFVRESEIYARALRVYYRSDEGFVWLPL
jgi:signal peptidase I